MKLKLETPQYKMVHLGRAALFYIPEEKLDQGPQIHGKIHDFLTKTFGGYTTADGLVKGYWKGEHELYTDRHRQYRVSFLGKERIPELVAFLTDLTIEMQEECLYLETGEDAWLLYPKN